MTINRFRPPAIDTLNRPVCGRCLPGVVFIVATVIFPAVGWAEPVWVRSAGGFSSDQGFGIAVDAAGNSYVAGPFTGTASFDPFIVTSAGSMDAFVAKYDTGGNVVWARSDGGTEYDAATAIAIDAAGNSYTTGYYYGTATFGPFDITSDGYNDIFVAKYDDGGNVLWVRSAGGTGHEESRAIAVDLLGNSYVTGWFEGTATFGSISITSAGNDDVFVAKYDTDGNVVWAESAGGGSAFPDVGYGVAVDGAGNAYVTGSFRLTATFGSTTLTSAGMSDVFVAKYDSGGNLVWARSAGGTWSDKGLAIAVDTAGNSHVAGFFGQTAAFDSFNVTSAGVEDIFVASFDESGNALWVRSAGGAEGDLATGIALDATGNSYVTGWFRGTATFGWMGIASLGSEEIFAAKYDSGGSVVWVQSAGGVEWDHGYGIGVDAAGNSYVTGDFRLTAYFGSSPLTSAGAYDVFVAKYPPDPSAPTAVIPTVAAWGLVVMALLGGIAGTLLFARRRPALP